MKLLAGFAALSIADGMLLASSWLTPIESLLIAALAIVTTVYLTRAAQLSR